MDVTQRLDSPCEPPSSTVVTGVVGEHCLSAQRELPRYATAGEPFSYAVAVANLGPRALSGVYVVEAFRDPRHVF